MISNNTTVEKLAMKMKEPKLSMASSSAVNTEVNTEFSTTSTLSIMQYCNHVHKLKRAWKQAKNDCNFEPKAKKVMPSAAGSSDYLALSLPGKTRVPPSPLAFIYNSPKPNIEEMLTRFPHIGEQIFANLNDQNITKCREVCDPWMTFLDSERLIWTRVILSHIEETNSWNWKKFLSTTTTPMLCKIARRIEVFYKCELNCYFFPRTIHEEMSPLHFAAMMYDDTNYCATLIKNDTINHPTDESGMTPLHYAAKYGYISVCQLLLEKFTDKNPKNVLDETPFALAVQSDNYLVCELIIRKYKEKNPREDLSTILNSPDNEGMTPLHLAAANGKRELCQLIIENVVEKNPESTQNEPLYGMTPLHFAAREGHFSVCELIVQNIDDKNPYDKLMRTPLYLAARQGNLSVCHLLYENAHNIDANELCMMLEEAVKGGHYDICKFFVLEIGSKIPNISYSDIIEIILRIAASKGNLDICKLITENLQINLISEHSYETPLHVAAKNGNFEVYRSIMKEFDDKNPKNAQGNTPLHLAAEVGHLHLCVLIIMNVKNKNPRNMRNETPMYLAAINNHYDVCALFFKRSLRYCQVKSTLLCALKSGYISSSVLTDLATSPKKHKSVELSHDDNYSDISD